jgi:hypothetical protein
MQTGDGLLPGRDIAIVNRHDGRQVAARLLSAAPPSRLAHFAASLLVPAGTIAATGPPLSSGLGLFVFRSFATRGAAALFTARALGLLAATWGVVQTCAKSIVGHIFRLDEPRFFRSRGSDVASRLGSLRAFVASTAATASSPAPGTPFAFRRRFSSEGGLLGIVEARGRRSGGLPQALSKRVVVLQRRRRSLPGRLSFGLRSFVATASATFLIATAGAFGASGSILAGAALVTPTMLFACRFFPAPAALGSLRPTARLLGAGLTRGDI